MRDELEIPVINKGFHDLNPILCGRQKCSPGHSFGPHIRPYYLLHYVTNGCGTYYTDAGAHPVSPGQIFIIRPNELTTYTADPENPWSYIWVGFTGMVTQRLSAVPPVISLTTNVFYEMLECEHMQSCREEFLAGKLFLLFTQLFETASTANDYVRQVCDYIDANYMNVLHIGDIARLVGVERTYLAKLFRQKMQISMQDYLVNTRLLHASQLLLKGCPVAEAAAICGYSDSFNFSRMFKRRYGVSPMQYKKSR